ncbi:hypothetical protein [Pelagimonas varians]|uniref:Uncharacterized protein n=3 Tax=Pelagimonas varians TaxID=696760 RepID=A0A238KZL0_9RHOB|nr:hypothetical protein C8N36_11520 [Pelagimonas varians]SMX48070.1 hypothetical protein PEV8663_03728 [Pelagimonas varians]
MNYILAAACCAALSMVGQTVFAKPVQYTCDVKFKKGSWVMPKMDYRYDSEKGTVSLLDGMIWDHNDKKWLEATIQKDTETKLVFNWRFRAPSRNKTPIELLYTATANKQNGRLNVTALLVEHNHRSFGRGTCKLRK